MITSKEELTEKALELFKKKGYENVSVQEICDACKVTRGSFYHHFKDREDLIHQWFMAYSRKMSIEAEEEKAVSSREKIWLFLKRYAEGVSSLGSDLLYHTMIANTSSKEKGILTTGMEIKEGYDELVELIRTAQEKGDVSKQFSAEKIARDYNCAITGMILQWYLQEEGFDYLERTREIFDLMIR